MFHEHKIMFQSKVFSEVEVTAKDFPNTCSHILKPYHAMISPRGTAGVCVNKIKPLGTRKLVGYTLPRSTLKPLSVLRATRMNW